MVLRRSSRDSYLERRRPSRWRRADASSVDSLALRRPTRELGLGMYRNAENLVVATIDADHGCGWCTVRRVVLGRRRLAPEFLERRIDCRNGGRISVEFAGGRPISDEAVASVVQAEHHRRAVVFGGGKVNRGR